MKAIVCFGIGMTLRDGNREYFYKKLDEHFPGMKQKYIRTFGNSYEVPTPNADRLHTILRETCDKHGIMLGVKPLFEYLAEFPHKMPDGPTPQQLTLFDL
ncbi:hypothetical protein SDC9_140022 [bioreactor metagenome]|uniref:Uncharacterized protein n=1 Tax=bioreactor metagenome TaxID=1076179 RepID=A0A645DU65_9ZZZZ